MELQDLFCVDVDSMTPIQAEMLSRNITTVLVKGGLTGSDQQLLITKNVEARRKVLGDTTPDVRADVVRRIEEAEARGDKRTAEFLADGMVKSDVAAHERELRAKEAAEAADRYWAKEKVAKEAKEEKLLQDRISNRTHELLHAHRWSRSEAECREMATKELKRLLPDKG